MSSFTYNTNRSAYQLTLSTDKYSTAIEWLLNAGCSFNAYFRSQADTVVFTFEVIPQNVIDKLNDKYNAVTEDQAEDLLSFFYAWTQGESEETRVRIYKTKLNDYFQVSNADIFTSSDKLAAYGIALSALQAQNNEHREDAVKWACDEVFGQCCLYNNNDDQLTVEETCDRIAKKLSSAVLTCWGLVYQD